MEFAELPDKLRVNTIFYCLEAALKGPRYEETQKIDRLPGIKTACTKVAADVGLAHIREMPNLGVVDVQQTKVTSAGVADLNKAKPKLRVITDK